MNVERLRRVELQILRYPNESRMERVHSDDGCHCIFGWAQVLFSPRFLDRVWRGKFLKLPSTPKPLFGYLGMDYFEGRRLYHVHLWPPDLRRDYRNARTPHQRAEVMARAIERFIADPGFRGGFSHTVREKTLAEKHA